MSAASGFDATQPQVDHQLVNYLLGHWDTERYLVGTLNANVSAPIILETDAPVMTLGGFLGSDPILIPGQLAGLVANGSIRFFLLPEAADQARGNAGFLRAGQQGDDVAWVNAHCKPVPADLWQSSASGPAQRQGETPVSRFDEFGGRQQLFDCQGAGQAAGAGTEG